MKVNRDELKTGAVFICLFLIIGIVCFLSAIFLDGVKEIWVGLGIIASILFIFSILVTWDRAIDK